MRNILLQHLQQELSNQSADISLHQLFSFVTLISRLRDDILLAQPANVSASVAPAILPPVIVEFISSCCDLPEDAVDCIWGVLKDMVWNGGYHQDTLGSFFKHGLERGLSACTL
jgi:hypothetical protein